MTTKKTKTRTKAKPRRRRLFPKRAQNVGTKSVAMGGQATDAIVKEAREFPGRTHDDPVDASDVVEQEHEEADRQEELTRSESDADTGARGSEDETDLEE
jgi:hypothetical protein